MHILTLESRHMTATLVLVRRETKHKINRVAALELLSDSIKTDFNIDVHFVVLFNIAH
jgi:hypothetical protein